MNRKKFARLAEEQAGERLLPTQNPELTIQWPDVLSKLRSQLERRRRSSRESTQTLVYSMLTDGFSPIAVQNGVTEEALKLVLEHTNFRIRVLTKNAIVGQNHWIEFFQKHRNRFVVGLSTGTLDDPWAKRVEWMTAPPSRRLVSLRRLQDAGIATYGMLCPVFPDMLSGNRLEDLVDRIRPDRVERIWVEPYNDRKNWETVRDGYATGSPGYNKITELYGSGKKEPWSAYATELYVRLRDKARSEGWLKKLCYLLYEGRITESDARQFRGLKGVLLQSKPGEDGKSRNPAFVEMQRP